MAKKQDNTVTTTDNAAQIEKLLGALRVCEDKTLKKTIRRQLRKLGHKGGLMHERANRAAAQIDELVAKATAKAE